MTATHVMVDDVAVRIRAQLLGAMKPEGQMAPAEVEAKHVMYNTMMPSKASQGRCLLFSRSARHPY